jgi:hypothetical protein
VSARRALVQITVGLVLGASACKGDGRGEGAGERAPAIGSAAAPPTGPATEARMRTYTMEYFGKPGLPRVTVTAEIPAAWTETLSTRGAPSFAIPGKSGSPPAITALGIDRPDAEARIEKAMELQYGAGTPDVTRAPLDGGRVWAIREEAHVLHARMFVPAPHGVVMAVALVKHEEAARLPEIEAAFRTVRVQAAP